MSSQRSKEGYLYIENRHAPAMDPRLLQKVKASGKDVAGGGVGIYESATYRCSHCHAVVVLNPARTRERTWCWNCDHVICDACSFLAKSQPCIPMARRLEEAQTRATRALILGR